MINKSIKILFLGLLSLGSIHCGYATHSNLSGNFRTVHVEPFKNNVTYTMEGQRKLYLPLLEIKTRNAVIERFQFDGNLKIAENDQADLVLKGQLQNYQKSGLRYTDNNDVLENRIQIQMSFELWDVKENKLVWAEPNFIGEATYFVSGSLAKSEEAAVDDAVTDLARRIVERTIENW